MMAFERLEPFGPLADEFRLGQIASIMANVHRSMETEAFTAGDFMPALRRAMEGYAPPPPPIELDPEAHSKRLDELLFGHTVH